MYYTYMFYEKKKMQRTNTSTVPREDGIGSTG